MKPALESILPEIDPSQDEILLVDDGSKSGPEVAQVPDVQGVDAIRLLRLPRSLGPASARNAGLKEARGKFITFFDSDDLMVPGALSGRLDYLKSHPEEIAVGGRVSTLIDEKGNVLSPYGSIHFYEVKEPPYRLSREFLVKHRSLPLHLWLVLFRREVFDEIGLLDGWLRCGEDLDFFCRVLESHTIPFIDCEVGLYRIHDDNLSLKKTTSGFQATQTAVASQFLICKKYGLTLKDSPFEAHVSFQFDGVRILLVHPNEPLGLIIEEEFARFKVEPDDVSPAARFEVRAGSALPAPQTGAIRTRYWEEFKSYEYRLGETRFELFQENYFAEKDFSAMRTQITYTNWENFVGQLGGSAFKWLVIKALEKDGYGYIHGSCLSLNEKLVVFSGDPGSGKSSCAMRLINKGAKLVSDDAVLFKDHRILPFDQSPSVRGDFAERFGVSQGLVIPDDGCLTSPVSHPLRLVIFPRVWRSEESEYRELSHAEAMERLLATYVKETEWNTYSQAPR